ncbi:MAG: hypothetical protein GY775_03825 [Candidatus Scalindua sp.]|nr:hypothetical protein [Candidatus Scalindua sp.]
MEKYDLEKLQKVANSLDLNDKERDGVSKLVNAMSIKSKPEKPVRKTDDKEIDKLADMVGKNLTNSLLSPEVRGMTNALSTLLTEIRNTIDDNGDKIIEGMETYLPPAIMKDPNLREKVMTGARKKVLQSVIEKDEDTTINILDTDFFKGMDKVPAVVTTPGANVAWPAAVAAVAVVATLVHSVYTSVADRSLDSRFSNPADKIAREAGRFEWF